MMDKLINAVSTKTGLSQDQARSAVDAVLGLLKSRLPAPLAGHLDSLLGGAASAGADNGGEDATGTGSEGLANEASALLGNLFGNRAEGKII